MAKATWISLLTVWVVGVAATITIATAPEEPPSLPRFGDAAPIVMPLEQVQWQGR